MQWRSGMEWAKVFFKYNMVEWYDGKATKATDQLYKLLISSDVPLIVHIKSVDLDMLRTQFFRLLWSARSIHQRIAYLIGIGNCCTLFLPLLIVIVLLGWAVSLPRWFFCTLGTRRRANIGQRMKLWYLVVCFAGGRPSLIVIYLSSLFVAFLRMNFMLWVFQVRCVVPSGSLDISRPGKLIYVLCVQSLKAKKTAKCCANFRHLILEPAFLCDFTVTGVRSVCWNSWQIWTLRYHAFTAKSYGGFLS